MPIDQRFKVTSTVTTNINRFIKKVETHLNGAVTVSSRRVLRTLQRRASVLPGTFPPGTFSKLRTSMPVGDRVRVQMISGRFRGGLQDVEVEDAGERGVAKHDVGFSDEFVSKNRYVDWIILGTRLMHPRNIFAESMIDNLEELSNQMKRRLGRLLKR